MEFVITSDIFFRQQNQPSPTVFLQIFQFNIYIKAMFWMGKPVERGGKS
jgi:hypothetical protein